MKDELSPDERARPGAEAERLQPWLQGPFLLGGDLVVGGAWRIDQRWIGLGERVPDDLSGLRVLDVGSNAGYDPFMFNLRGAEYVLACEPFVFYRAGALPRVHLPDRHRLQADPLAGALPEEHGRFDIVHCHGVLYHELHPDAPAPAACGRCSRPAARCCFGSMMLAEPELSEYARFVPGATPATRPGGGCRAA